MRTPEETAALADRITVETPEGPAKIAGHFHEDGAWAMADPVDGAPNTVLAYCAAELAEAREKLAAGQALADAMRVEDEAIRRADPAHPDHRPLKQGDCVPFELERALMAAFPPKRGEP